MPTTSSKEAMQRDQDWSARRHGPWIASMAALRPGESFELPEARVKQADSTLRSARITLWGLSREWGWEVWFQKRQRPNGLVLQVTRAKPGELRGSEGRLVELARAAKALPPGKLLHVTGEDAPRPHALRDRVLQSGAAISIRHFADARNYQVLRWRDEHLAVAKKITAAQTLRSNLDVEAALVALPLGGVAHFGQAAILPARKVARRLGIFVSVDVKECGQGVAMTVTRHATAPKQRRPPSRLKPWMDKFDRLRVGAHLQVQIADLEAAGTHYAGLAARMAALPMITGKRASLRRSGGVVTVTRVE